MAIFRKTCPSRFRQALYKQLNTELKKGLRQFSKPVRAGFGRLRRLFRKQRSVWKLAQPVLVVRALIRVFPLEIDLILWETYKLRVESIYMRKSWPIERPINLITKKSIFPFLPSTSSFLNSLLSSTSLGEFFLFFWTVSRGGPCLYFFKFMRKSIYKFERS